MNIYSNGYNYYNTYGSSMNDALALQLVGRFLFGIILVASLISIIISVIGIVGQWKMFKKAGDEGWKSLIPFYNTYTMCKLTGVNPWWILIVVSIGLIQMPFSIFVPILSFIFSLFSCTVSIYFSVLLAVSVARSYGKDEGWAVGIFFLRPFFYLALGCGKSEYVGPKPMNDPILKSFGNSNQTASKNFNYCPNCGNKLGDNARFCSKCGKEL